MLLLVKKYYVTGLIIANGIVIRNNVVTIITCETPTYWIYTFIVTHVDINCTAWYSKIFITFIGLGFIWKKYITFYKDIYLNSWISICKWNWRKIWGKRKNLSYLHFYNFLNNLLFPVQLTILRITNSQKQKRKFILWNIFRTREKTFYDIQVLAKI